MSAVRVLKRIGVSLFACAVLLAPITAAQAQQAREIQITHRGKQFHPAEISVPAKTSLTLRIKNLDATEIEFESEALHFEKIIPANGEATVSVSPQSPGRYEFYDEMNEKAHGFLIVK